LFDRRPCRTSCFFAGLFLCGALLALSPSWGQDISANQIDELITKLRDSNPNVRQRAAIELGRIDAADERVVPALIKALDDKDEGCAATALAFSSLLLTTAASTAARAEARRWCP